MKVEPRYDGPAIVRMEGDGVEEVGPACVRQRRRLLDTLAGLSDDDWRAPSRCDGWTVRDVAVHLTTTDQFWQWSISSGLAGSPTRTLDGFDPKATPADLVAAAPASGPAETLAQLRESSEGLCRLVASLDDEQWATIAEAPAGHLPVRLVVHHALWDCWVHERDIVLALGHPATEEPDEVMACLRFAAGLGPAFAISVGRARPATLAIETSEPDGRVVVEVSDHVTVHDRRPEPGQADVTLRGRAADLVEAMSCRVPLDQPVPDDQRWLVASLAQLFETADLG